MAIELRECLDERGRSPYAEWFEKLDSHAAQKVEVALWRIEAGNLSNVRPVGGGVLEYKIHFGTGYRIYFGREGAEIIILVAGGTKQRQQQDISTALRHWRDYKERKQSRKRSR